ncbi:importin-13-like [Apostichopus japonicus]|uniref:importin-13-like n=1 Tax=Stichopus japonicus TaxID=307972 RepID=UPI003AB3CCE9
MAANDPTSPPAVGGQAGVTEKTIEEAILKLYYDPNPAVKDVAQRWLFAVQRSPEAWQFAWELLVPNKRPEIQFFGASALCLKISKFWKELSPEQYDTLRTKLFEKIFLFSTGEKIVLRRLCVALSAFTLNTAPEVWPDAIAGSIDTFQQVNSTGLDEVHKCTALLEFLTVLPEEFHSSALPQGRRAAVRSELQKGFQKVMTVVQSLLSQANTPPEIQLLSLRCLASWVKLDVPLLEMQPIIDILCQMIHNQDVFELCIEALIEIISQPSSHKYPDTIRKLLGHLLLAKDMLNNAVDNRDMDIVEGFCRLMVSLGENHSKILITECTGNGQEAVAEYMKIVVGFSVISGHYPVDETISTIPLIFWYTLQDEILSCDKDHFVRCVQFFVPYYYELIEALLVKAQYPSDKEYTSWTLEEKEQFRCYRQDISDTFMNCFSLLHEPLLSHIYTILMRIVQSPDTQWQPVESCLFAFQSVAEGGNIRDCPCLNDLFRLLGQVDMSQTYELSATSLNMLGAFSEWLCYNTESLEVVIPLLVHGINEPSLCSPASMALKAIATECIFELAPYAETILTSCQQALAANNLKSKDSIRVMSIVGVVLSTMKLEDIMSYLEAILNPQLGVLETAAKEEPSPSNKSTIVTKLNMLAFLCHSLDVKRDIILDDVESDNETSKITLPAAAGPQPVLLILPSILPVLEQVLNVWVQDTGVVEAVCSLLQRCSRTLLDDFKPMSSHLCQLIGQIYSTIPQSSVLELAEQIFILFGSDEDIKPVVHGLLVQLCNKTFTLLPQGARDSTDVLQGFLSMCKNILRKQIDLLTNPEIQLPSLFQCGLIAITLPEDHTIKTACAFFVAWITNNGKHSGLQECLQQQGKSLLEIILKGISGAVARRSVENMADVLYVMVKDGFPIFSTWINELLSNPQFELPLVSKDQRINFGRSLFRNKVNKRQVQDSVKEFSLMCRGLHGMEYAQ